MRADEPSASTSLLATAIGAVSGMRSLSGVAALARASAIDPRPTALPRALSSPRAARALAVLSAGEMMLDKNPRMPARTSLAPYLGRIALGAVAGAGIAARGGRGLLGGAILGALGAAIATKVSYEARMRVAARFREGSPLPGVIEDGLVTLASAAIVSALVRGQRSH